jgi:ribosomal protein L11 methyltransferase
MDALESRIFQFIADCPTKVSFRDIKQHFCISQLEIIKLKKIIAHQIEIGKLCYTSHYGGSFIEVSYAQPSMLSKHVILKPPHCNYPAMADELVITIERGVSFGGGEHPTTRMAVELIDDVLYRMRLREKTSGFQAIDIGTGSGILAIVAAKLGVDFIHAIDTDPCAVFEARKNVRSNRLQSRISVMRGDLNMVDVGCDCIFANLRTPSLISLRDAILRKIDNNGMLIFSGIREEEMQGVCDAYHNAHFQNIQKRSKMGWSAVCLARGSWLNAPSLSMNHY